MSIFQSREIRESESFPFALSPYNPDPEALAPSLPLYVDEGGTVNLSGPTLLLRRLDPLDSPEPLEFSPSNKFIQSLARYLPTVPVGGIILYGRGVGVFDSGRVKPPSGFVKCDGGVYEYGDNQEWITPLIEPIPDTGTIYIQRIPDNTVFARKATIVDQLRQIS